MGFAPDDRIRLDDTRARGRAGIGCPVNWSCNGFDRTSVGWISALIVFSFSWVRGLHPSNAAVTRVAAGAAAARGIRHCRSHGLRRSCGRTQRPEGGAQFGAEQRRLLRCHEMPALVGLVEIDQVVPIPMISPGYSDLISPRIPR
jgi:hypothetical protein